MPGTLDGKVAIVTGAGRGLGRTMTLGLLDAGACVAAAAGREEAAAGDNRTAVAAAGDNIQAADSSRRTGRT